MSADGQMAAGETVADRYKILRVLGEGGMGVVYAAEHMLMRKEVALKVLHGDMNTMPEIVARFEREAVAAGAIDHPNVAAATDFGRLPDGACYLVLELLKGESLRDEIRKGPMPLARALVILRGIANGVAAAHAKGIVHRDLKPENVMLVEKDGLPDFVKVLDFGIAKMDQGAAQTPAGGQAIVTRVGTIFGTPEYMAPEQAVGDKIDARADIFAIGVILLEMLTGKCPFKGEVLNVLRERILMTTMPDMTTIPSADVRALITKMMQRHPDDRLQSATELLAAIDQLEAEPALPTATTASSLAVDEPSIAASIVTNRVTEAAPRPRWVIPAAAGGVALVLLVVAVAASGGSDKKDREEKASATKEKRHAASSTVVKHAPPPVPEPVVSAAPSAEATEPEPDALPSASAAPSARPAAPTRPQKPQQRRKTGPGGIYIPPPKDWFK